jgi:hypothetical protein
MPAVSTIGARTPAFSSREAHGNNVYRIEGTNGYLLLMRHRLVIARKHRLGFFGGAGYSEKSIVLRNITDVEVRDVHAFFHSQICFNVSPMVDSEGGSLYADPQDNVLNFREDERQHFHTVKAYVESVIRGWPMEFDSLNLPTWGAEAGLFIRHSGHAAFHASPQPAM